MRNITIRFEYLAAAAGFLPEADGKLNIPLTQGSADELSKAVTDIVGLWKKSSSDEQISITLTGSGPVWGYIVIAHTLYGRVAMCHYAPSNAAAIKVFG
jgi:hypothetical protein